MDRILILRDCRRCPDCLEHDDSFKCHNRELFVDAIAAYTGRTIPGDEIPGWCPLPVANKEPGQ